MCGIAGYIINKDRDNELELSEKFSKSLHHRGPDADGVYKSNGVCLLNTRLSIIDIKQGQQPFFSYDNQVVCVQNGEIYNYLEIRNELKKLGHHFKTNSDTEVILKAYEQYGLACFNYFNGMFAIAILDKRTNRLVLARDRLGVKPLFVYTHNRELLFSSEIKTFKEYEYFNSDVSFSSIHTYMKYNYIPPPDTIFEHVKHVEPGCFLEIDIHSLAIKNSQYWDLSNSTTSFSCEKTLVNEIDEILSDAVKIRLRGDVEAGAFLSGGLDSSLVVAVAKRNHDYCLNSFSIGFEDKRFDESLFAQEVADYVGISTNIKMLDSNIYELWKTTTYFNDQPHGDISFIPTYILSKFAASQYKMVLTGDGGDELFAGYLKYFALFEHEADRNYFDSISLIKKDALFSELYTQQFINKININAPFEYFSSLLSKVPDYDAINKALYIDTKLLLPGNNLVKPDRMGMANSLEARSPFMDYRLYELMSSVPGKFKLRDNTTKYILKKLAARYLPDNIIHRRKQMFTVPVGEWFKGPLQQHMFEVLSSSELQSRNIFNQETIKKMAEQHVSGKVDYTRELRAIVNLEMWFRLFHDK